MAHPGKYSKVEVDRKNVVGVEFVAGTTHTVGSGLKPGITGLEKTAPSPTDAMVMHLSVGVKLFQWMFDSAPDRP